MKQKIVIVGGGTGGTILANLLATKLHREIINNKVELLMISDPPVHYYKPAFMYVAFNSFFKQELTRSLYALLRQPDTLLGLMLVLCTLQIVGQRIRTSALPPETLAD